MSKMKLIIVFLIVLILSSCVEDKNTVTLLNEDGTVYEKAEYDSNIKSIELPTLYEENKLFIGWSLDEEIYYNTYSITGDVTLSAMFENIADVFEIDESDDVVKITGYKGNAEYLKIPQVINGKDVHYIDQGAFMNSTIVELYLPRNIRDVGMFSFQGSAYLTSVSFYGEVYGGVNISMNEETYTEFTTMQDVTCDILEKGENGYIKYSDGCPIIEVITQEYYEPYMGEPYTTYKTLFDVSYNPQYAYSAFRIDSFSDCLNLEYVEIPETFHIVIPIAFRNTPKLKTVETTGDNNKFTEVDGVIYTSDITMLKFYPAGLTQEEIIIPETVIKISSNAFYENHYIEHIVLPDNIEVIMGDAFYSLTNLESFLLNVNNPKYSIIDDVLYETEHDDRWVLRYYPSNKSGASYVLPEQVNMLADGAFSGNKNLTNIDLSNGLLSTIHTNAFNDSVSLTYLEIPETVRMLFGDILIDTNVKILVIKTSEGVVVPWDSSTTFFYYYPHNGIKTYVPDDLLDEYKAKDEWADYIDLLYPLSDLEEQN